MKLIHNLHAKTITRFNDFNEDGQSTAEYSLVIVGAAAIAGLLITWAGGTGAISNLFETVIRKVLHP